MPAKDPYTGAENARSEACSNLEKIGRFKPLNPSSIGYSISLIRDEARQLLQQGFISRQQPIYTLCQYIPVREWIYIEQELEANNFLLRDCIGDLIGEEKWLND